MNHDHFDRRSFLGHGLGLGLALLGLPAHAFNGPVTWVFGMDGSASVRASEFLEYQRMTVKSVLPLVQPAGDTLIMRRLEDPQSLETFSFGDVLSRHVVEVEKVARYLLAMKKRPSGGSTLFVPTTDFFAEQIELHRKLGKSLGRRRFVLVLVSDGEADDKKKELAAAKRVDAKADWLVLALGVHQKNLKSLQGVMDAAGLADPTRQIVVPYEHMASVLTNALTNRLGRSPDQQLSKKLAPLTV